MGPSDAAGEEASVSGSGLRPLAGRVRRRDGASGQGRSLTEKQTEMSSTLEEAVDCRLTFKCGVFVL